MFPFFSNLHYADMSPRLGTCGKDFLLVSILSLHCSGTFPCCASFAVLVHSIFLPKSRTAFLMSNYFLPFHLLPWWWGEQTLAGC